MLFWFENLFVCYSIIIKLHVLEFTVHKYIMKV